MSMGRGERGFSNLDNQQISDWNNITYEGSYYPNSEFKGILDIYHKPSDLQLQTSVAINQSNEWKDQLVKLGMSLDKFGIKGKIIKNHANIDRDHTIEPWDYYIDMDITPKCAYKMYIYHNRFPSNLCDQLTESIGDVSNYLVTKKNNKKFKKKKPHFDQIFNLMKKDNPTLKKHQLSNSSINYLFYNEGNHEYDNSSVYIIFRYNDHLSYVENLDRLGKLEIGLNSIFNLMD